MSYDILFQQAIKMHENGDYDNAEKIYRQILETAPKNPDILNLLGLVAQAKGVHSEAVNYFYKAIQEAPNHAPFYFNLAISLNEWGKIYEAIETYGKVIELDNTIAQTYNNLGLIHMNIGDKETALDFFSKAQEIDNSFLEPKAAAAFINNDIESLKAIDIPLAKYYLSLLYQKKNDFEKALEYALQTEEYMQIAELYLLLGNVKKAESCFQYSLSINPNSVSAMINLANIDTNRKRYDEAEAKYKKALDISPNDVNAHINYANMLYLTGRFHEALEENRKAVILDPDIPEISNNIGIILKDLNEYEQAVDLFFNAFTKKPKDEFAINIYETLLIMTQNGKKEEAAKIAESWKKLAPENAFAIRLCAAFSNFEDYNNIDYSEKLFEHFAESYEDTLKDIKYNIPNKIKEMIGNIKGNILDIGCGTGLLAEKFKNDENSFFGVDISANMLEKAKRKNIYTALYKDDIHNFLKRNNNYDWILAADVFGYIGDLDEIISLCKGTKLCFSIEESKDKDYFLCENGRYKHKAEYVSAILKKYGFSRVEKQKTDLRIENNTPVEGFIYMAE